MAQPTLTPQNSQVRLGSDGAVWYPIDPFEVPGTGERFGVRFDLHITDQTITGVYMSALASFDLYWDGQRVGRSGRVGESLETEHPGPRDIFIPIPLSLTSPGIHKIRIEFSRYHTNWSYTNQRFDFMPGDITALQRERLATTFLPLILFGTLVIGGLYFTYVFLLDRRMTAFALFSLLCLATASLVAAESWRYLFGYAYPSHLWRLVTILALTHMVCFLLPAYLLYHLKPPFKPSILMGLTLLLFSVYLLPGFDLKGAALFFLSILSSLAIGLIAWFRSPSHLDRQTLLFTMITLSAGMIGLLWDIRAFHETGFILFFALLVTVTLMAQGHGIYREQQTRHKAEVASERLKFQLLKQNIQPHFIMNSLTSAQELLEQSPKAGAEFIQALAEEFRLFSRLSEQKKIPLGEEIALCETHLKIMGYRRGIQFELCIEGTPGNNMGIPPAILHTLIENAITHNAYRAGPIVFTLTIEEQPKHCRLTLACPMSATGSPQEPSQPSGLGLAYIRTRLTESYGDNWTLDQTITGNIWQTQIIINTPDNPVGSQ